jgi:hypothetical protein
VNPEFQTAQRVCRFWKIACALEMLREVSKLDAKGDHNLDAHLGVLLEFTEDAAWQRYWELDEKMDKAKGLA